MAVNDAADFGRQLDVEFEEKVEGQAKQVVQKLGLELLSRVVLRTPVAIGRARGSWDVTIGQPTDVVIERIDPSGQAAIADGTAAILSMRDLSPIWLQSNLAYIGALEHGHSQQAPAGMVAVSVEEVNQMFARVR